MSAISIRNIPENTYLALKKMARQSERSLQEQVRYLLEQEVKLVSQSSLLEAKNWRDKLKNRNHSDSVKLIQEDRER
jgi:plasmid stability protein